MKEILEIIAYCERQAKKYDADKKPEPHPLDFSLSTWEEEQEVKNAVWAYNSRSISYASVYWDLAQTIRYTYIDLSESLVFKDFGSGI
jgi:hypothetical protein